MNQKTIFALVGGILVLAFFMASLIYRNHQASTQQDTAAQSYGIAERVGAATKGPEDARVTIVEFFDPACETCRDFLPLINNLINQYPGKVRVMLRYAPLHPGSDQVVKMLEAAHQQGQFWPALELLFSQQNRWTVNHRSQPAIARDILKSLDIDQQRLTADINSEKTGGVIQQDILDGQSLNVKATPEFFVNGQPLPSWGYQQLQQLVKETVEANY